MEYRALLFDLDDTLLDFSTAEDRCLDKTHKFFFADHCERELYKKHYREINHFLWELVSKEVLRPEHVKIERFRRLCEVLQVTHNAKEVAKHYEAKLADEIIWLPGVKKTLKTLHTKFKMGIVTNGLTEVQEKKYHASGLSSFCHCLLISEKVGISKPNKAIFSMAMMDLATLAHETLMIGDSLTSDFQGAINAGLDFCWINPKGIPLPKEFPKPKYILKSVSQLPSQL